MSAGRHTRRRMIGRVLRRMTTRERVVVGLLLALAATALAGAVGYPALMWVEQSLRSDALVVVALLVLLVGQLVVVPFVVTRPR